MAIHTRARLRSKQVRGAGSIQYVCAYDRRGQQTMEALTLFHALTDLGLEHEGCEVGDAVDDDDEEVGGEGGTGDGSYECEEDCGF